MINQKATGENKMRISNENNTMTLFLEGRIDTNNASQTEQEIFSAIEDKTGDIIRELEQTECARGHRKR